MGQERRSHRDPSEELQALRRRVAVLEAQLAQRTASEEKRATYENLFKYSGESMLVIDPDTHLVLDANSSAARRLEYRRDGLLGLKLEDIEVRDVERRSNALMWESTVSGTMFYECRYRRQDGSEMPVEVSSRLVQFGGKYVLLNSVRDITKRKEMEDALRESQRQLEAQNEELRAFNHTVAHDLKTPLTAIIGYADLLCGRYDAMSPDRVDDLLEAIVRTGYTMSNIIDELMLLAGVREAEVELEPIEMGTVVADALDRLAYTLQDREVEVIQPDTWPGAVGHGPWVEEVWVNYISNAIKYGGKPPRVELGAQALTDDRVRFWVKDNGPGLSAADQVKLFAPFERLHQVRIQGHGLGLSIVRRIMEKLGGKAGVASEGVPGRGCTFTFDLPATTR
jgi:PAS domain S-box-containing protein